MLFLKFTFLFIALFFTSIITTRIYYKYPIKTYFFILLAFFWTVFLYLQWGIQN